MKKTRFLFIATSMVIITMMTTVVESFALRVLDYTYNCVGSGGNCLPTVIVTE